MHSSSQCTDGETWLKYPAVEPVPEGGTKQTGEIDCAVNRLCKEPHN